MEITFSIWFMILFGQTHILCIYLSRKSFWLLRLRCYKTKNIWISRPKFEHFRVDITINHTASTEI